MAGNVRISQNATYDVGFLGQALASIGVAVVLTEPNGTVEVNMTEQQLNTFQGRFPQYPISQVTPVQPDAPTADTYLDQAPPAPDVNLEGGETIQPDPQPN